MSLPKTKEQDRAERAWAYIETVQGKPYAGRYGAWAKKLPALILTNGLGQTLAFLKAKGKEQPAYQQLYDHLSEWVVGEMGWGSGSLLEKHLIKKDSTQYRQATTEALAFINWLKRFSEAALDDEEGGGE